MTAAGGLDVFYPIVPDAGWAARLVPLGVRTLQLRLKDASPEEVRRQIGECLELTRRHGCQLIVNDYWREAIGAGADYIHLGQEDLAAADVAAIKAAGLRLGVSTHSEDELEIALAAQPDYVALGPVYETKLKVMKWAPQGLMRVSRWKERIGTLPLVAIGGNDLARAAEVCAAGAAGVAVISAVAAADDPVEAVRELRRTVDGLGRERARG
jgi:thiamine-phosphate pyrophosphorylase